MYISQDIAQRIRARAKQQNVSIGEMLSSCELGINTISKMAKGTDILTKNLAKIADYLDCSVDYLLGRTDVVEVARSEEYVILPVAARSKKGSSESAEPHKLTKQQWEEAQEALSDLPDRKELPKFNLDED